MRLLTYNIRSLRDDAHAVVRVIRACEPDVVAIQEAPRFLGWRVKRALLARRCGLRLVAGGRSAAANLLMAAPAVEVVATRNVLLTKDRGLHQRGAAIAVMRLGGASTAVAGTHLDLVEPARVRHVGELHEALDAFVADDVPAVVAGDINDLPGSRCWQLLTERRVDAWAVAGSGDGFTFSARNPQRRIDGVFADPRLRVVSAAVISTPDVAVASDHRPVLVEFEPAAHSR